ncbi:hypothetical protein HII31_07819 [Pseudocercospora fuligena]|uniref:Uncharacterized protein n=1 Tax=Pseudocercospora fuligena TaxID=685502 RepID=A0A8H6VGJ8_9PEZI|nr:hypothetical protein HII31_07819 [Pseudocercospora fuligena]
MKKLGAALQEVNEIFDTPTPATEVDNPMAHDLRGDGRGLRSPDLRPQNSCERSRSEDKRQSGLTSTPFISSLALVSLPDSAIGTLEAESKMNNGHINVVQSLDGTRTPAAARPLLRRSTSDALRASQQKLRQLQDSTAVTERPATPNLISPTPVRRSRSSTYTTFCNEEREPQKDRSSTYLPHPSHDAPPPNPQHSPSVLGRHQPIRPPPPHRTPSHEVRQRESALQAELESLRGQLSTHEQRGEREMVAVNFALNRIAEQQNNQMHVQQMLLEKLAGMDLQATQGIQEYAAAHQDDEEGKHSKNVLEAEQGVFLKEESGLGWTAKAEREAAEASKVKEDEIITAEVEKEWSSRTLEG